MVVMAVPTDTDHQPPRRLLHVVHAVRTLDPAGGGIVTFLESLCRGLRDDTVQTGIEAVFPTARHWRVLAIRRPIDFHRRIRALLADADALHVHGVFGWHVLLGVLAARRMGRAYVITLHGHLHPDALRERRLAKRLCLALFGCRVLRGAGAVLVTTDAEREIVARHVEGVRTECIMPGLEVPASPPSLAADRRPVAGSGLRVLYLGRLHPHKGVHRVIEALAALADAGIPATLMIAGRGDPGYARRLDRQVASSGLNDRVRFLGHVDAAERARLWPETDVLVLPSRSENFGFAAAEAMAAGRPVIVGEGVGLAPLVMDRDCGHVIPADDACALADALEAVSDSERRMAMGRNAHAAALDHFSQVAMGTGHERVYRRLVGMPPASSAAT